MSFGFQYLYFKTKWLDIIVTLSKVSLENCKTNAWNQIIVYFLDKIMLVNVIPSAEVK